tara:strand:+ start:349 stop:1038 length:690 start_codon:yes stop_codon:yes gene_type:complete
MRGYDIVIPVYNEKKILDLLSYIIKKSKNLNNILICYDFDYDITIKLIKNSKFKNTDFIKLVKNNSVGPCNAVKSGIKESYAESVIVYPADDFFNGDLLDIMFDFYQKGYEVVCPSRFIKGGIIKNCPLLKYSIVKFVSFFLFYFSRLNIKDPTNGFRFFSKKVLNDFKIESTLGFAYSLELLVKAHKKKYKIKELPSTWIERLDRKSSFKILAWSSDYLKWFLKCIFN